MQTTSLSDTGQFPRRSAIPASAPLPAPAHPAAVKLRARLARAMLRAKPPSARQLRGLEHLLLHLLTERDTAGNRTLIDERQIDARLTAIGLTGPRETAKQAVRDYEGLADEALATRSLAELEARAIPARIRGLKYALRSHYLDKAVVLAAVQCLLLLERMAALPGYADQGSGARPWRGSRLPVEEGGGRNFVAPLRPGARRDAAAIPLPPSTDSSACPEDDDASLTMFSLVDSELVAELEPSDNQSSSIIAANIPHGCGPTSPDFPYDSAPRVSIETGCHPDTMRAAPGSSDTKLQPRPGDRVAGVHTGHGRAERARRDEPSRTHRTASTGASPRSSLRPLWIGLTLLNMAFSIFVGARVLATPALPRVTVSQRYHTFTLPADGSLPIQDARRFDDVLVVTVDRRWGRMADSDRRGLVAHLARHLIGQASIQRLLVVDASGRRLATATGQSIELDGSRR